MYIGYQKIQRVREQKAYQDQFDKVTQLEKSSEKGKDVQVQEGILGTSYVTAYYPTKDGWPLKRRTKNEGSSSHGNIVISSMHGP